MFVFGAFIVYFLFLVDLDKISPAGFSRGSASIIDKSAAVRETNKVERLRSDLNVRAARPRWQASQFEFSAENAQDHLSSKSSAGLVSQAEKGGSFSLRGFQPNTQGFASALFTVPESLERSIVGNSVRITVFRADDNIVPISAGYMYSSTSVEYADQVQVGANGSQLTSIVTIPAAPRHVLGGEELVRGQIFNESLNDGVGGEAGFVPSGWTLDHRMGGPARRNALGFHTVEENSRNVAFGNMENMSGIWGLTKKFEVFEASTVSVSVKFISRDFKFPEQVTRDSSISTYMAEDDVILQAEWYDVDDSPILTDVRSSWSDSASQIASSLSGKTGDRSAKWQTMEWVFQPPPTAKFLKLTVHAVDGDESVVGFDHIAGNASVLLDEISFSTDGVLKDTSAEANVGHLIELKFPRNATVELSKIVIQSSR